MKKRTSLSFKNRLAVSYSVLLTLMLLAGAIFYHASFKRVENGINALRASTLAAGVQQLDALLAQLSRISYQAAKLHSFKTLSSLDPDSDSFVYSAWLVQEDLRPVLSLGQAASDSSLFIYMGNSGYLLSPSRLTSLDLFLKYEPEYRSLDSFGTNPRDTFLNQDLWYRFIPLTGLDGGLQGYLYICPIFNSMTASSGSSQNVLCFRTDPHVLEGLFSGLPPEGGLIAAADAKGRETLSLAVREYPPPQFSSRGFRL